MAQQDCFEKFQYTTYPCYLDNTKDPDVPNMPEVVDEQDEVNALSINRIRNMGLAIEYELGPNPSGQWDTLRDRLDHMDRRITENRTLIDELTGGVVTSIKVQDEGTLVVPKAQTLNFVGDAVTVTQFPNSTTAKIVITGGLIMIQVQETFPAVAGTPQDFTLSYLPDDVTAVLMFVNGVKQQEGVDYTVTGKVVTYTSTALSPTDVVEFWYLAIGSTVQQQQESVVAAGGETGFVLSVFPTQDDAVQMYVNGLKQDYGTDYTVGGKTVTYNGPPAIVAGDIVEFWYITGISGGGGGGGDVEVRENGVTVVPIATAIDFVGPNWTITNLGGNIAQVEVDGYQPVQETLPVTINGQQDFSLTSIPGDETTVEFFIEGVKQEWGVDYTVSGTTVHYNDTDILVGDVVDAVYQTLGAGTGGGSGSGGCCSLGSTLQVGRMTAGEDIEVSNGDVIRGEAGHDLVLETTTDGYTDGYTVIRKDGYELARFDDLGSSRLLFPAKGFVESDTSHVVLKSGTYTDGYITYDGYVDVNLQDDLLVRHWRHPGSIGQIAAGPAADYHFPGDRHIVLHTTGIEAYGSTQFQFETSESLQIRTLAGGGGGIQMFSDYSIQMVADNGGIAQIIAGARDGYSSGGGVFINSGTSEYGSSGIITIVSAETDVGNSGDVLFASGIADSANSGIAELRSGQADAGSSGNVLVHTGNALTPGLLSIYGGGSPATGGTAQMYGGGGAAGGGGGVYCYGGDGYGGGATRVAGGNGSNGGLLTLEGGGGGTCAGVIISGGSGSDSGSVTIKTLNTSGTSGNIDIEGGGGSSPPGDISIYVLDCSDGEGGDINVTGGQGTSGGNINIDSGIGTSLGGGSTNLNAADGYTSGGQMNIGAGNGTTGGAGNVNVTAGNGYTYGGNVNIGAGDGTVGVGGNLAMTAGLGTPTNGYFSFTLGTTIPLMRISDIPEPESIPLALMADSDAWVKGTIRDGRTFHIGTASISGGAATADVEIFTGDSSGSTGNITLQPGSGTGSGVSGASYIYGGDSASAASAGSVFLTGGNNTGTGSPGTAFIAGGVGANNDGGNVRITGGQGNPNGGDIELTTGDGYGAGHDGYIIFYRGIGNEVARWDNGGSERLLLQTSVVEFGDDIGDVKLWMPPSGVYGSDGYGITIQAQTSGYGGNGGDVTIITGDNVGSGGDEGDVIFSRGDIESARFDDDGLTLRSVFPFTITKSPATATNELKIAGQDCTSTNNGGDLKLYGGQSNGTGGHIYVTSGGGQGSYSSGSVYILTDYGGSTGYSGSIEIKTAFARVSSGGHTGDITISCGRGDGAGDGGSVSITGGDAGATGNAGDVNIAGGDSGATSGTAGNVIISGGAADNIVDGGAVELTGAAGGDSTSSPAGDGGNVTLRAGDGGYASSSYSGDGGIVILESGIGPTGYSEGFGGADGYIMIRTRGEEIARFEDWVLRWGPYGGRYDAPSGQSHIFYVDDSGVATVGINSGYNALTFPDSGAAMIKVTNRSATGIGRPLYIRGSDATVGDNNGGNITIEAGDGNGSGDGGNVNIDTGADGGTGTDGVINLKIANTTTVSVVAGQLQSEGAVRIKEVSDPGTPASGYWYFWADSSDGKVKLRDDQGNTTVLAGPS